MICAQRTAEKTLSVPLKSSPAMNSAQNVTMRRDPQGNPASESAPRAKVGDPLDELSGRAGRAATFDSHKRSIAAIPR